MRDPTADPTLDRLLRHMAWGNATLFARLAELTDQALALAAPRNEWTVAMILEHIVMAAGATPRAWREFPAPSGPYHRRRSPSSPPAAPPTRPESAPGDIFSDGRAPRWAAIRISR